MRFSRIEADGGPEFFHPRCIDGGAAVEHALGLDGADQALLEYLRPDVVVGRYSAVVLGSGDGRAFTPAVRALHVQGVPTDVVAPERSTAWSLRAFARSCTGLAVAAESFALAA